MSIFYLKYLKLSSLLIPYILYKLSTSYDLPNLSYTPSFIVSLSTSFIEYKSTTHIFFLFSYNFIMTLDLAI